MILNYINSSSTIKPEIVDDYSSAYVTYLRRNIVETKNDDNIMYNYEECQLTKAEYAEYLKELEVADVQKQRADIDYIAMLLDIDLEV